MALFSEMMDELGEWKQAARVEAGLRREFLARAEKAESALGAIWKIVHVPTKVTRHRSADDHFQADFDAIRKIIASTIQPPTRSDAAD